MNLPWRTYHTESNCRNEIGRFNGRFVARVVTGNDAGRMAVMDDTTGREQYALAQRMARQARIDGPQDTVD